MTNLLLITLSFFSLNLYASNYTLKDVAPFPYDGCTKSPDGHWVHCCYEHDVMYWLGGSFEDRKRADQRLQYCMNKIDGPGDLYYTFVRDFGRGGWGNAWPNHNNRDDLNADELEQIRLELELFVMLGSPHKFDFVKYESIVFKSISEEDLALARVRFQDEKRSGRYQEFLRVYKNSLGEDPITTILDIK